MEVLTSFCPSLTSWRLAPQISSSSKLKNGFASKIAFERIYLLVIL